MNHEAICTVIMLHPLVTSLGIGVVLVLICIALSLVNHAEHGKTGKTWFGDDDDAADIAPCVIAFCSLFLSVCGSLDVSPFICQ